MTNSTPQGPGPEFGSAPDASPLVTSAGDERAEVDAAMDAEVEDLQRTGEDDGVIDLGDDAGPNLNADTGNVS